MVLFIVKMLASFLPALVLSALIFNRINSKALFLQSIFIGGAFFFAAAAANVAFSLPQQKEIPQASFMQMALMAFLSGALTEELFRFLFYQAFFAWRAGAAKTDKILAAVLMSVVFGLLENTVYALTDWHTALLRSFTALPLHAALGFLTAALPAGVLISLAIHSIYNFLLLAGRPAAYLIALLFLALIVLIFWLYGIFFKKRKDQKLRYF